MNRLDHGLRAEELTVLPHERADEIAQHVESVLSDLGVETPTELLVGKSIALKLWQKKRIEEIETRRLKAEVLHRLDDTEEMRIMQAIDGALSALTVMVEVMTSTFPADRETLDKLLVPVGAVMKMLEQVESSGPKVFVGLTVLTNAVTTLQRLSPQQPDALAYGAVVEAATASAAAVAALLPAAKVAVEQAKDLLASSLPLPDDRDAALRSRYMKDLDRRLAADMQLMAQLHHNRAQPAGSGSFGQAPGAGLPA